MPLAQVNGSSCHYRLDGADDLPVLVLSHSLGLDLGMWDELVALLGSRFQVLRYDTRGHGGSSAPTGDYTMADLGADALALIDALGVTRFAWCGQSLGGMVL
jgi:3-oxoadipate enol-lactonase